MRYHDWVEQESRHYQRKTFLAKKGDVLFWHPMLFHGGQAIERADSTRKSLVIHYMVRGTNRAWARQRAIQLVATSQRGAARPYGRTPTVWFRHTEFAVDGYSLFQ